MTKEEFEEFLKAKEAMLKKNPPAASQKDKEAAARQGNRGLTNQGVRRVQPNAITPGSNSESIGPLDAPTEYREAYREFTRQLNEVRPPNEKK
jgi:hypothetical protein